MKILPVFLFLCIHAECQDVFIRGTVDNYNLETIPLYKKDYTTFKDLYIPVAKFSDNYYEFHFKNPKPQWFKLFLNWVYIEPGDSVQFDFSFIDVSPNEFYDSVNVKGKYPGNYIYYRHSKKWLDDRPVFKNDISQPASSFYKALKDFYFKTFAGRIRQFVKQYPVSKGFYRYIHDELHIKFLADVLQTFKNNAVILSGRLRAEIEKEINISKLTDERFIDALDYVNFGYLYLEYFLPNKTSISSFGNYLNLKKTIERRFTAIVKEFWMSLLVRSQYFNKPAVYVSKEDSLTNVILVSLKDTSIRQSLSEFIFTQSNRNEKAVKEVELINTDGNPLTIERAIANDSGYIKVIDFWASWCVPCLEQSKKLEDIKKEFRNLRVIKISVDKNESDWRNAISKHGYSLERQFRVQNDNEGKKLVSLINLESLPRFLIATKTGKIAFFQAFFPADKNEFLQQIGYADAMDKSGINSENTGKKNGSPKPPGN